ncbi:ABC transporter permease [Jatrophihabitans sp. DSM 45814]
MNPTYLKYEILRTVRNRQAFIFSLVFPIAMFFIFGTTSKTDSNFDRGINGAAFYMIGMLGFGTIGAVVAGGGRISMDRQSGWNRQLRLSPLSPRTYLATKVLLGYLVAFMTIALLYAAGISQGVRLSAAHWIEMTVLILIALIPFAALGVWVGHRFSPDAMGPLMGGLLSLFSIVGGSYFPVSGTVIGKIGSWTPSYWLNQAGRVGLGGDVWSGKGWAVIAVWSAVFAVLGARAYRADTKRA